MPEKEEFGLISHCSNQITLDDAQPLIEFLSRLQKGEIDNVELELLQKLLKADISLALPKSKRGRQYLLRGVIENVRGSQAATERGIRPKRELMEGVLARLKTKGIIRDWQDSSRIARYDYRIEINNHAIYIEAKGGFDGNSTRISEFPPDAHETWKWFMVEGSPKNNPSSQVKKNRLMGEMVRNQKAETGFLVLDYLCGDPDVRPCPKPSQARISILPDLQSPFPDVFLLPPPPWPHGQMTWATWIPGQQLWLQALASLWKIEDTQLSYHLHLVGIEMSADGQQFRWGMRMQSRKEPWYLSQFRQVR